MRILMWFTTGFTVACLGAAYLLMPQWLLLAAGVAGICAVLLFFLHRKPAKVAAIVCLGCALGFVWNYGYHCFYLRDALALDGQKLNTVITVTDYSTQQGRVTTADGTLTTNGKAYTVKLYLYEEQLLNPGDKVSGTFKFRYTSVGTQNDSTYHQGKGIFLLATADDSAQVAPGAAGAGSIAVRLRRDLTRLLDRLFPADTAGFARALLLGDKSGISYEMDTAFAVSGISHVVAVSGLHVSILFSLIQMLCWHKKYLSAIIGIPLLVLFAAVAGFTPSVLRACMMQLLMIGAELLMKDYDPPTALSFAVLCLLAANPMTVTSVGFQLSVACVVGIIAFARPICGRIAGCRWIASTNGKGLRPKLVRGILSSVSISLSVWLVTAPLCALHFGMVSLVSIFTNLLTIWMVSYIFYAIIAACLVGAIFLPAGVCIAWVAAWLIRLVQWISMILSYVPFAAVYTCSSYILIWLIGCYVLVAMFCFVRFRKPAMLVACMVLSLGLAVGAACIEEKSDSFRVSILDVGQGQCILLKNRSRYYLVDCGGDSAAQAADICAQYLLSRGILYLDGLILTHYDDDHAGGVANLLSRVPADRLYLPDIDRDNAARKQLEGTYRDRIQWVSDVWMVPAGAITLVCDGAANHDNESGICVLFQPDNYDILITGDRGKSGERALMQRLDLPKLELLIAGHHGSASATSMALLEETMPLCVAISVGEDNPYGHPSLELLQRLELFGCQVLRTDLQGTVEFGG